ncbi:LacI family transcriptional regulator [Caproiciproducens sp. NJN-50]|uniref:LacI family DNA-binding transcriptional regulator n=1 Tax=Caproiciproducens sp. NJN-50 TaxID=2507162 RepID=UPI000FFDFFB5|nr:LacI family DNA-binding transcriptional regulator [Caproiciproducens sp. NJN-50]QAT48699.1 LacI family transcriptional regulator [Caproiciproducens sp. NJN-50]
MPTLKELAALAGVSPTTASVVMRGEGDQRNISQATQRKIMDAAKKIGYQTNLAARRLRSAGEKNTVVALYWATDFRAPMMVRFLHGLQRAVLGIGRGIDIIIRPYENGNLCRAASQQNLSMFNGAIICNASQQDMEYLEGMTPLIPTVLYNRSSVKFCAATINNFTLGSLPARIFALRGHKRASIITSEPVFAEMWLRTTAFLQTIAEFGMEAMPIIYEQNSMRGGYLAAMKLFEQKEMPDCIFFGSDAMAAGALRTFFLRGIKIPRDLECISIGNGDRDLEENSVISISNVQVPMEDMAEKCLNLLLELLEGKHKEPFFVEFPVVYHPLESCGSIPVK